MKPDISEFRLKVKLAETGDREALDALWHLLFTEVYKISRLVGRRRGIPEESIDDIVQDTIIAIMRHFDKLAEIENLRGWLHRIIGNKVNDYLRWYIPRKNRELSTNAVIGGHDDHGPVLGHLLSDNGMLPDDITILVDLGKKYIQSLDEINFRIYRLYAYDGYNHHEIADQTGFTLNAIRIRIHRIKKGYIEFATQRTGPGGKACQ